jgi:uroporphyrinogen-III decarboxylase
MASLSYDIDIYTERVRAAEERLTQAYSLEEGIVPIVQGYSRPLGFTAHELHFDKERMLKQQLHDILLSLQIDSDQVPGLWPYHGTGVLASAFGCETVWPADKDPWTKPVIMEPGGVYSLREPDPQTSGLLPKVLETIKYFNRETKGKVPIKLTDTQGPLDTASLVWDYTGFMRAMHNNPAEVHMLLKMVTDLVIEFSKIQFELMEDPYYPSDCFPRDIKGRGIGISDDLAAVVSPAIYRTFGAPYNSLISQAFGGLHIHSCGDFTHNLGTMLKIPELRCVNWNSSPREMEPARASSLIRGSCAFYGGLGLHWQLHFANAQEAYRRYLLPSVIGPGCIVMGFGGESIRETNVNVHWIRDELSSLRRD